MPPGYGRKCQLTKGSHGPALANIQAVVRNIIADILTTDGRTNTNSTPTTAWLSSHTQEVRLMYWEKLQADDDDDADMHYSLHTHDHV